MVTPVSAASVSLNKIQTNIYVGNSTVLRPTRGTATNWQSSNPSIASVSGSGVVLGRRRGTCVIACRVSGVVLRCTVNVRTRQVSRYISNAYSTVWKNILGAVESGGQVYGRRDYAAFAGPGANSPNEYSCTAGAYQEYGENLRQLLVRIRIEFPYSFYGRDGAGIISDLRRTWSDSNPYRVYSGSTKARVIQKIISSSVGQYVQDLRAVELMDLYFRDIRNLGVRNLQAAMFMAECYHLGGFAAVRRVVNRASNKNSISSLRTSLYQDQYDYSNSYQIGDSFYRSRHELVYRWLTQYIPASVMIR